MTLYYLNTNLLLILEKHNFKCLFYSIIAIVDKTFYSTIQEILL